MTANTRTIERSARVHLDQTEARCEPQYECKVRTLCARWLAAVAIGSPMIGGGMGGMSIVPCPHFKAVDKAAKATAPQPRRMKHWSET